MKKELWPSVKAWFPIAVLAAAFVWACAVIITHRVAEKQEGEIVLRIGHWQLEASVREAIDELAAEYRKTHPDIRIVQDAIPESTYGQWVTTQLMGGTAPDMMEVGLGLPWTLWLSYLHRYFIPVTSSVGKPNPWNAGTDFASVPLRQTYKDGMRGSYYEMLQDYMTIPLSQFGVRIFYNKDLLKKLTGLDSAPEEYRAFLAVCAKIKSQKNEKGQEYVPIAGSQYHTWPWEIMLADLLTYPALRQADFNRDGFLGNDEQFVAFRTGRLSFDFPPYRARFKMFKEISENFQTGYTGLTRDEAVFLFAQQRAVFLPTGTWDARNLEAQAEGRFAVGISEFPLPTKEDPEYGPFVEGPLFEVPQGGFPFGITRTSQHPEIALDFLLFLASKANNEKFNRIIGWIPCILGTKMDPMLEAFEPHLEGVYGAMNFFVGGNTWVRWTQDYSLFQVHQITYDELAARFGPVYMEEGLKDFMELQREWRRGIRDDEQFTAGIRAQALMADGTAADGWWIKYFALSAARQIAPEITHARQMRMIDKGPATGATAPYDYSPAVLEKIRARRGR